MKVLHVLLLGILLFPILACKGRTEEPATINTDEVSSQSVVMVQKSEEELITTPIHITKTDFLEVIMNYEENPEEWVYEGELPCIVDFYADWCAPCRISNPILEELAVEYAGKINIYKVDVDKEQELASVFGIQSIPSFLFCPMEGNPSISQGIMQTPEETKVLFQQQIEEILLNSDLSTL